MAFFLYSIFVSYSCLFNLFYIIVNVTTDYRTNVTYFYMVVQRRGLGLLIISSFNTFYRSPWRLFNYNLHSLLDIKAVVKMLCRWRPVDVKSILEDVARAADGWAR